MLRNKTHPSRHNLPVTAVSGLPRSGTSLMMQMLEAGGLPLLTDAKRQADTHNPRGYYELEQVKWLARGDAAWLAEAQGKALKVISNHLMHLPPQFNYRVIFMRRHLDEVMRSQAVMRDLPDNADAFNTESLSRYYKRHLLSLNRWLQAQRHMQVLYVDYNLLLHAPQQYTGPLALFLEQPLHESEMLRVIDPQLYRQRSHPTMPAP